MLSAAKGSMVVRWSGLDTDTSMLSIRSSMVLTRAPPRPRTIGSSDRLPETGGVDTGDVAQSLADRRCQCALELAAIELGDGLCNVFCR